MATVDKIPNLWPSEVTQAALTPQAILKAQAGYLREQSRGVLEAEVETVVRDTTIEHHLDVIAPAVGGYRHRIATLRHDSPLVYPATLWSDGLSEDDGDSRVVVSSDGDLLIWLRKALLSDAIKSVLISLIAQSNAPAGAT